MRFLSDDQAKDTRPGDRQLEVIAAGLPRCATSSLQAALESPALGLSPCMHMARVAPHADRLQLCLDAMREPDRARRHKLLRRLFAGCAATCDFPGVVFTADLMDMHPGAAVVLNQRGSAREWAASYAGLQFFAGRTYLLTCLLWRTDRLHWRVHQVAGPMLGRMAGGCAFPSEEAYEGYNAWVREQAALRGRQVLEFRAEDGYPALCEFLGRPAPAPGVKYPHLNDAGSIKLLKAVLVVRGLVSWAALLGGLWASWIYVPSLVQEAVSWVQRLLWT